MKLIFYVLDEKTVYEYVLNIDEGIAKTVRCPYCDSITVSDVDTNVDANKEIDVTCSKCGNKFIVSLSNDNSLLDKIHSFLTGKK